MDAFVGKKARVVYGDSKRELVGWIFSVDLGSQRLKLQDVAERDIPQGDLTLRADKIRDLTLVPDDGDTQASRRNHRRKGKRDQRKDKETFGSTGTADESFSEDFDFAGNNAKFNKDEVFAQYKIEDEVPESERLVSHNVRTSKKAAEPKMGIHEMVLAPTTEWITDSRVVLATVPPERHRMVIKEAETCGMTAAMRHEAGGSSACELLVHLLGLQHNAPTRRRAPPVVVFLVGATDVAGYTLCAARRLASRNVRVVVYMPPADDGTLAGPLRLLERAAPTACFSSWAVKGKLAIAKHCPEPPDMVVEAFGGDEPRPAAEKREKRENPAAAAGWAAALDVPRVSFGPPVRGPAASGGTATVCCQFGLPTLEQQPPPGCQLYLVDNGIAWSTLAQTQPTGGAPPPTPCASPFFTRPFAAIAPLERREE